MSNLVERLHDKRHIKECLEAADEIERLRAVCKDKTILLQDAYAQNERLRARIAELEGALRALIESIDRVAENYSTLPEARAALARGEEE